MIKGMINGAYGKLDTAYMCRKIIMLHSELVPNVFLKLCRISITSVECERVFSCQNRLKSKFRASLSPEKLDILTVIHNGPFWVEFNPDKAIQLWKAKNNWRIGRLTHGYKPRLETSSKQ